MSSTLEPWRDAFAKNVANPADAAPLKEASLAGDLKTWTKCLTNVVVRACEEVGWRAAGKGHRLKLLPKAGQEYHGIDVMAFSPDNESKWPLPLAAFELENSSSTDLVAYSLWKVLNLRVNLRVVFAYRTDREKSRELVQNLKTDVIRSVPMDDWKNITGQTIVAVGNRGEGLTFPWGYFMWWVLNPKLGTFEKI